MNEVSRTSKSIKNSYYALIFCVITLILNFFSRKVFLNYLGTDILGLNTTAQNLLQFLNLAELGIGVAVGFSLYQPLYYKDYNSINEILTLQGHLYKRIAYFILMGAVILMLFFPLIFKKIDLPLWYTYASFSVFLYSSLLSYFVNYKQVLLTASQNDYKIQYSYRSILLLKILAQMWAVYEFTNGYIWWLIFEVLFASLASLSLHFTTLKTFPHLIKSDKKYKELRNKYSSVVTKIKQLFVHRIAGFALNQATPIIIYALIDLNEVAIYGNYTIITLGILTIMSSIFNSINAGVGNLIVEGNDVKIKSIFEELFSIRFVISSTLCFSTFILGNSFVELWIGEEYLLPYSTLLLIVIQLFINLIRTSVDNYVYAYGIFGDVWAPVIEAFLNISLSVLFGVIWGLNGIILGVITSLIIIPILWKPYYLFSKKIKNYGKKYIKLFMLYLFFGILISFIVFTLFKNLIYNANQNFINLISTGIIISLSYFIIFVIIMYPLNKGMKDGVYRLIKFCNK